MPSRKTAPLGQSNRRRILADREQSGIDAARGTNLRRIRRFVAALSAFPTSRRLVNPYRSRQRRQNLETYLAALLEWPYSGHLLIGEAPGERGCARTGVPFTDERMLRGGLHPFLKSLRPTVRVDGSTAENTAGIVWNHLCECSLVPAFWNAVPFHPRSAAKANRAPTANEVQSCQVFLDQILRVLAPRSVIAVGRTAELALVRLGLSSFQSVRHPSHGGKREFLAGLTALGIGVAASSIESGGHGAGLLGRSDGLETCTWISSPTTRTG
jgi:uracil-DNA glycosylase